MKCWEQLSEGRWGLLFPVTKLSTVIAAEYQLMWTLTIFRIALLASPSAHLMEILPFQ